MSMDKKRIGPRPRFFYVGRKGTGMRPAQSMPIKRFILLLALFLPFGGMASESAKDKPPSSAIDLTLPIHQQKKLHPELSDPVLGDQAQIVEWAWSPQYAKRFGLPVQSEGLKDGALWLVGVKVQRVQYQQWQRYTCNIIGVMDNKLPIITPPGEVYMIYPTHISDMPGKALVGSADLKNQVEHEGAQPFIPAQAAWYRHPQNKLQEERPETGIGHLYKYFYRHFQQDLAYFEWEGGCGYFRDPEKFRNEIRFPTRIDGKNDADKQQPAVYESSAIHFDIPDVLMRRIYPYTLDADDWSSCFGHRTSGAFLSLRATKSKRFGNICEPATKQPK
jgi:hypothetical protein